MKKNGVKVTKSKGGFRVIIPHKIVKKMGWDDVTHVKVEYIVGGFVLIRRMSDDKTKTTG